MTIELMIGGANLAAMVGYFLRSESRITKLETLVQLLIEERKRK
jgi:hypothetical protein